MSATSHLTADLKQSIDDSLSLLRRLRDEVRVNLHLAQMDARDRWVELEPQLAKAERAAHEVSEASKHTLAAAIDALRGLKESLTAKHRPEAPPPTPPTAPRSTSS